MLVHEIVSGNGRACDFTNAAEHRWWREADADGIPVYRADGTCTLEADNVGKPLIGKPILPAVLFKCH